MNILLRQHFGVEADPWRTDDLATADAVRARHLVRAAAGSKLLVSIAGRRGSGKTRAVRSAARGLGVQLVEPLRLDREKLHLGDIQAALVRELSDEPLRRSGEARSGQTRRVLGTAATRGSVLLWIDDAHLLHHGTVRGLKRLRELTWRGEGPLLGTVLTGQTDRTAAIPEVGLRSDRMTFAGLTAGEAGEAIARALGALVDRSEASALAASDRARNWLDLGELVDDCLAEAVARGEDRVTRDCAAAVLGTAPAAAGTAAATAAAASDDDVAAYLRRQAA